MHICKSEERYLWHPPLKKKKKNEKWYHCSTSKKQNSYNLMAISQMYPLQAPLMDEIVVTKEGVTKFLKGINLAVIASHPCDPLKHIYKYTNTI